MKANNKAVTIPQLSDMKHTIGLEKDSQLKRINGVRTYAFYRNYFMTGSEGSARLDGLVEINFMRKLPAPDWCGDGFIYSLTPRGIHFLEQVFSIKIKERR